MDADDFIPHLGKPADDPDLQRFLAGLGVTQAPKLKRGDTDARIELDDRGVSLVFRSVEERSTALALRSVQFYGNTQGGLFTPYARTLPLDLHFTDSRAEAQRKAGPPSFSRSDWPPTNGTSRPMRCM